MMICREAEEKQGKAWEKYNCLYEDSRKAIMVVGRRRLEKIFYGEAVMARVEHGCGK